MKVFVTGAGLLGLYAARRWLKAGDAVTVFERDPNDDYIASVVDPASISLVQGDITDQPALSRAIHDAEPDVIVHTAGLIGGRAGANMHQTFQTNVVATMHVAEAAATFNVPKVIFCSTVGVYNLAEAPGPDGLTELHPVGSGSPYGNSKLAAEQLLLAASRKHGFQGISLRYSSVYGRGHFFGGSSIGQAIDGIIRAAADHTEMIFKPGVGPTEYTYVKDIADAIESASRVGETKNWIFNIGTGVITTPDALVEALRTAEPESQVKLDPNYQSGQASGGTTSYKAFNLSRAQSELGYKSKYSLVDGITDYIKELRAGRALD